jgi:hypothetical protein
LNDLHIGLLEGGREEIKADVGNFSDIERGRFGDFGESIFESM